MIKVVVEEATINLYRVYCVALAGGAYVWIEDPGHLQAQCDDSSSFW